MAGFRIPGLSWQDAFSEMNLLRTPGPLGKNDAGDLDGSMGDSPGPVGLNDYGSIISDSYVGVGEEKPDDESEGDEHDSDPLNSVGPEPDEDPEDGAAGTPKKRKPVGFRRKPHRTRHFAGRLTKIFGGTRGKYRSIWSWSWGKVQTEREPPTRETRVVTLMSDDAQAIPQTGDSLITAHGAAFYKGEPIAGNIPNPLAVFQRTISIAAAVPGTKLAPNEKCVTDSVNKTVTGSLNYCFGDPGDPATGPQARIVVEVFVPATGLWAVIHTTNWVTTQGNWRTDSLNGKLTPDSKYRVSVQAQYWKLISTPGYQWADGRTQIEYTLTLQQQVTATYSITKTTAGKVKVVKKAKTFRIRL